MITCIMVLLLIAAPLPRATGVNILTFLYVYWCNAYRYSKICIVIPMKVYGKFCTITHAHSPLAWNLLDVLLFPRVSYPLCMRCGRDTVRLL